MNYTEFDNYVKQVKTTYKAKGIAVALFDLENILYEGYFGEKDDDGSPIDRETIFGIASITKSFTVLGAMKLHQEGIINIHDPITKYIPELRFSDDRQPTLLHLMSHTVGYYPQFRLLIKDMADQLNIDVTSELSHNSQIETEGFNKLLNNLNKQDCFLGAPGELMSYSNDSYGLLTEIVRRFGSEDNYCDYIRTSIIEPLGLKDTFFEFNRTQVESNITTLYTNDDKQLKSTKDYKDLGFVLMGGGGIKSNINDLIRYTRFFINNGETLIDSNLIKEMSIPRSNYKPQHYYGLGLMTGHLDDIDFSGHSGGLTGVSSYFAFSKSMKKGVVVLCNTGGVPAASIGLSALRFLNGHEAKPTGIQFMDRPWSKSLIGATVGDYTTPEGGPPLRLSYVDGSLQIALGKMIYPCRMVQDDLLLMKNKMEENTIRILRHADNQAWGLYFGSRVLKKTQ